MVNDFLCIVLILSLSLSGPQCLSAEQILSHFGFSNVSQLTVGHLGSICPAVLTQVLLPSCPYTPPTPPLSIDNSGELLHHNGCTVLFPWFYMWRPSPNPQHLRTPSFCLLVLFFHPNNSQFMVGVCFPESSRVDCAEVFLPTDTN